MSSDLHDVIKKLGSKKTSEVTDERLWEETKHVFYVFYSENNMILLFSQLVVFHV